MSIDGNKALVLGSIDEHGAHDPAQSLLGQDIVADVIDGHGAIRSLRVHAFPGG